jgi:hypothetical protein
MENTLILRKNIITIFVVCVILYFIMSGIFYKPSFSPVMLKTTQDSLCLTPEGWPIPCP